MARPPAGLNTRQASQLLRCQQLREARVLAEAARCAAEHTACRQQVQASQAAAAAHAVNAAAARRHGYDALIGHGSATAAIHALHAREAAERHQRAQLAEAVARARALAEQAATLETAARQRVTEATRHVARRERLLEIANRHAARSRAALDERRNEDGHHACHAPVI